MTESMISFYDRIAGVYDSRYEDAYSRFYDEVTWKNLCQYLPDDGDARILDAGGGTGYCTIPLAKLGFRTTLVDISPRMLAVAEAKLREARLDADLLHADLCDLSMFSQSTFDMVVCQGSVLSCCTDYATALKELHRVLRPDGMLNVSVHQRYGWIEYLLQAARLSDMGTLLRDGTFDWMEADYPVHRLHTFTAEQLCVLLREIGFSPVRVLGKVPFRRERIQELLDDDGGGLLSLALEHGNEPQMIALSQYIDVTARRR